VPGEPGVLWPRKRALLDGYVSCKVVLTGEIDGVPWEAQHCLTMRSKQTESHRSPQTILGVVGHPMFVSTLGMPPPSTARDNG
jgi:hypothetical protein